MAKEIRCNDCVARRFRELRAEDAAKKPKDRQPDDQLFALAQVSVKPLFGMATNPRRYVVLLTGRSLPGQYKCDDCDADYVKEKTGLKKL